MEQNGGASATPWPDLLAARLRVNQAMEVRILAQTLNGNRLVHIREYVLSNENEFVPTPKGVAVSIEKLEAVLDGVRSLREAGTAPGVHAVVPASRGQEIRFSITSWQGATKADIRLYFQNATTKEHLPTK